MRHFVLAATVATFMAGCGFLVDDEKAKISAETQGYESPEISERHRMFTGPYGCNDAEFAAFIMHALFLDNSPVQFTMCCGPFYAGCRVTNLSPRNP